MNIYEINKVLVPIDFSPLSESALLTAVEICKRHSASVTLLHIVENTLAMLAPKAGIAASSVLPELGRSAEERLRAKCMDIIASHKVHANFLVATGSAASAINHWAVEKKIDLIVLGTEGITGVREYFMGTNAYKVVKNSTCPVLTIPSTKPCIAFKNILFPVRPVPSALEKYHVIKPIIDRNGSSVRISGIVETRDKPGMLEMNDLVTQIKQRMLLDDITSKIDVHVCDNAARCVLDIASADKPDLIVITATVGTTLQEFFLNPYTQDILNHSRYPVLSIRPEDQPAADGSIQVAGSLDFSFG